MGFYQTCDGCEHLCTEDAGKKDGKAYTFFLCRLGKFERCTRPVLDYVPTSYGKLTVPIPAWCKKGIGYVLGADGRMRQKGEAYGKENSD